MLNSAAVLAALMFASEAASAGPVADFYRGRQVSLIVGYGTGGYDVYGRLMARHLGRHIPGQPNVVVQNMPGAGSLRAANHLYTAAPKDGSAIRFISTTPRGSKWMSARSAPRTWCARSMKSRERRLISLTT